MGENGRGSVRGIYEICGLKQNINYPTQKKITVAIDCTILYSNMAEVQKIPKGKETLLTFKPSPPHLVNQEKWTLTKSAPPPTDPKINPVHAIIIQRVNYFCAELTSTFSSTLLLNALEIVMFTKGGHISTTDFKHFKKTQSPNVFPDLCTSIPRKFQDIFQPHEMP